MRRSLCLHVVETFYGAREKPVKTISLEKLREYDTRSIIRRCFKTLRCFKIMVVSKNNFPKLRDMFPFITTASHQTTQRQNFWDSERLPRIEKTEVRSKIWFFHRSRRPDLARRCLEFRPQA